MSAQDTGLPAAGGVWTEASEWLAQKSEEENKVFEEMGFDGSEPYHGSVLSPKTLGLRKTDSPKDSEWWLYPDTYAYRLYKLEQLVDSHARMAGGGWD